MKNHFLSLATILFLVAIACQSTSTPIPPAIPLNDQVLTAAAYVQLTQVVQPIEQPTQPAIPTETPIPPPPPASESIGNVGETVQQGSYVITLANVETAKQYGDFSIAAAGNRFIAVELLIESTGAEVHVNPFYVSIKDGNGYVYSSTFLGKEPALQSQNDLPIGEKMRGWVTFEMPETAINLVLSYEPITFTNTIRIRFNLGY